MEALLQSLGGAAIFALVIVPILFLVALVLAPLMIWHHAARAADAAVAARKRLDELAKTLPDEIRHVRAALENAVEP